MDPYDILQISQVEELPMTLIHLDLWQYELMSKAHLPSQVVSQMYLATVALYSFLSLLMQDSI